MRGSKGEKQVRLEKLRNQRHQKTKSGRRRIYLTRLSTGRFGLGPDFEGEGG